MEHAEVDYDPKMKFSDFISVCQEKLGLGHYHRKLRLFDATGDEIYEDDFDSIDPKEPMFLSQGEAFDKASSLAVYDEIRPLGSGGFGTVKLYRHRYTRHEVAIKFVDVRSLESIEDVNRIFDEVTILRRLSHENIVVLLDALMLPQQICLIMEFCKGGELKQLVEEEGKLTEEKAYSVAVQIIAGIRYCHNFYVIHRDLKMENILFADRGRFFIKIVDFGISGAFKVGAASERSDAGSLLYAAPEVVSGSDNRARPSLDVWSIGCIFYQMLTGKHPFLASTVDETIANITSGWYPPLPDTLTAPWKHVIRGALQLKLTKRWSVIRIEEHLQRHRDDPAECPECIQGMEEEEETEQQEEQKTQLSVKIEKGRKSSSFKTKNRSPINESPLLEPKKIAKKAGSRMRKTLS